MTGTVGNCAARYPADAAAENQAAHHLLTGFHECPSHAILLVCNFQSLCGLQRKRILGIRVGSIGGPEFWENQIRDRGDQVRKTQSVWDIIH